MLSYPFKKKRLSLFLPPILFVILFLFVSCQLNISQLAKTPTGMWECDNPEITIDFGEEGMSGEGTIVEDGVPKDIEICWRYDWKGVDVWYTSKDGIGRFPEELLFNGFFQLTKDQLTLTSRDKKTVWEFYPVEDN